MTKTSLHAGMLVRQYRNERSETQTEFGKQIGLGPSKVSEREKDGNWSFDVALAIEELSAGQINAAELNAKVAQARAA